ncbi:MAG TPA: hypothetical protein PKV52_02195 [Candidatus Saccharibacteria bacterium]|nr:hypothetical protein [Candidatus Saccharibacteria bacterium]
MSNPVRKCTYNDTKKKVDTFEGTTRSKRHTGRAVVPHQWATAHRRRAHEAAQPIAKNWWVAWQPYSEEWSDPSTAGKHGDRKSRSAPGQGGARHRTERS